MMARGLAVGGRRRRSKAAVGVAALGVAALVGLFALPNARTFVPAHDGQPAAPAQALRGLSSGKPGYVMAGSVRSLGEVVRQRCGGMKSGVAAAAVGLFFATQTGNTETAAGEIAEKAGLEATDIGEVEA